jgi:DNA invertase Pin-like site-specific DNA recombinase
MGCYSFAAICSSSLARRSANSYVSTALATPLRAVLRAAASLEVTAPSPSVFIDDTPTSKMIRQLLGVISEFEKASLVAKLAGARRRKRTATGHKVEGRKSHAEERPEVVALVKALRRRKPKGGQMSLRTISAELAAQGHLNERGKPFNPNSIAAMLGGVS